ncbi:MAG: RIP metalloprotease RseP [Verrucomicrobiota bacterium]
MILEILKWIASILGVCVVFGVTVFVHELGHFLAARRKGLYVDRFSIGFGPKIFGFKRGGVEYIIGCIPFGGYVSLPQMAPMEMVEGKVEGDVDLSKLPPITPWAKIVTAFWGPLFSFLLALACATLLFFIGKNQNVTLKTTTVGFVEEGSPAATAGVLPGDVIKRINGQEVTHWSKNGVGGILQAIVLSSGETIKIELERDGELIIHELKPEPNPDLEGLRGVGFENLDNRYMPLIVEKILTEDAPAAVAGLQSADQIVAVDGKSVYSMAQISEMITSSEGAVTLSILRDGNPMDISVTPRLELSMDRKMIGVVWRNDFKELVYPNPLTQVQDSLLTMGLTLYALVNPKSDVGPKHMSGPIGIFDVLRKLLLKDFRDLMAFCVFFNVNLAILNLLPLPILDGGHITFAFVEWLRRKPMNVKVLYGLQTSFFIILIAFMLFVSFHDVLRIKRTSTKVKELKQIEEQRGDARFAPESK